MSRINWTPSRVYGGTYWTHGRFGIIVDRLRGPYGTCTLVVNPARPGAHRRCIGCANFRDAERVAQLAPGEIEQLGMAA